MTCRAGLAVGLRWCLLLCLWWAPTPAQAADGAPIDLRLHIALHDLDGDRRPPLERLTRRALRDVEGTVHARLDGDLRVDFVGSDQAFRRVVRAHGGGAGQNEPWIAGLALLHDDRIVVRLGGDGLLRTSEVVRHEIAHVAIHALAGQRWLPRWYHEGVAMVVAGEATFDRLQEAAGASAFGELENLDGLDAGFAGNRIAAERAYAVSAGFLRFAMRRANNPASLGDIHRRMSLGLDFGPAFTATFGLAPEQLFALYVQYIGAAGSRWSALMTETTIWSLVSVLFVLAMFIGWLRRPVLESEPMDLRAIAEAGEAAMISGRLWQEPEADASADLPPAPASGAMRAVRAPAGPMREPRPPD